jgi:hypothetical protein
MRNVGARVRMLAYQLEQFWDDHEGFQAVVVGSMIGIMLVAFLLVL